MWWGWRGVSTAPHSRPLNRNKTHFHVVFLCLSLFWLGIFYSYIFCDIIPSYYGKNTIFLNANLHFLFNIFISINIFYITLSFSLKLLNSTDWCFIWYAHTGSSIWKREQFCSTLEKHKTCAHTHAGSRMMLAGLMMDYWSAKRDCNVYCGGGRRLLSSHSSLWPTSLAHVFWTGRSLNNQPKSLIYGFMV